MSIPTVPSVSVSVSAPAPASAPGGAAGFLPTQWSVVLAASRPDRSSRQALEKLCSAYWPPSFWYFRRQGHPTEAAEDLTQEFFQMLLTTESFHAVNPEKGRFRSWLLGALKHFHCNDLRKARTLKRGGGQAMVSLDAMPPDALSAADLRDDDTPETAFDRKWATTLLAKARSRLEREYALAEQSSRFAVLKHFISSSPDISYSDAARELGMAEEATKSAIYKFRQRFGKLLRHEVAQTVPAEADVEEELRFLVQALRD